MHNVIKRTILRLQLSYQYLKTIRNSENLVVSSVQIKRIESKNIMCFEEALNQVNGNQSTEVLFLLTANIDNELYMCMSINIFKEIKCPAHKWSMFVKEKIKLF